MQGGWVVLVTAPPTGQYREDDDIISLILAGVASHFWQESK